MSILECVRKWRVVLFNNDVVLDTLCWLLPCLSACAQV